MKTLRQHVRKEIGPIASPRQIMVVAGAAQDPSGKIMRRLLRDVAENRELGDVTTLTDSSVMELISSKLPTSVQRGLRKTPAPPVQRAAPARHPRRLCSAHHQ